MAIYVFATVAARWPPVTCLCCASQSSLLKWYVFSSCLAWRRPKSASNWWYVDMIGWNNVGHDYSIKEIYDIHMFRSFKFMLIASRWLHSFIIVSGLVAVWASPAGVSDVQRNRIRGHLLEHALSHRRFVVLITAFIWAWLRRCIVFNGRDTGGILFFKTRKVRTEQFGESGYVITVLLAVGVSSRWWLMRLFIRSLGDPGEIKLHSQQMML